MSDEEQEFVTHSPLPVKSANPPMLLDFPNALREVLAGKSITRLDWRNPGVFVCLVDETTDSFLEIYSDTDEQYHTLTLRGVDMLATDWVVVEE